MTADRGGSSMNQRRNLFLEMILEEDDVRRAELRRQYVVAISMDARESMRRYRRGRPLGFVCPDRHDAVRSIEVAKAALGHRASP